MKFRIFDVIQSIEKVWKMEPKNLVWNEMEKFETWNMENFYFIPFHSLPCLVYRKFIEHKCIRSGRRRPLKRELRETRLLLYFTGC